MRRIFSAVAIITIMILCAGRASAQGFIVKGGLNYTRFDAECPGGYDGWYAGVGYQTYSRGGFSFQPELIYRVNGASFDDAAYIRMNYLELPVNIQWGINLLIAKPFLFVSPFVGYNLSNVADPPVIDKALIDDAVANLDYGVGAGVGLNFWQIQLTAKYNRLLGKVADWNVIRPGLSDLDIRMATFELSLGLRF